jgi:hypothetical protein
MNEAAPQGDVDPPQIASRLEFSQAVHWAVHASTQRRARRIVWVDADFADWPLDDAALHETLSAWLRLPQRRLVLLAARYDEVPRRHPRFTAWRRLWSHAVEAWSPAEGEARDLPTLALDDGAVVVHLVDSVHWRGRASLDERAARVWRDQIDAVLQRSEPAFAPSALGL